MEILKRVKLYYGGERLYVHPFSYYDIEERSRNKVLYFTSGEFPPHHNDWIADYYNLGSFYSPLFLRDNLIIKYIWYNVIKKFFVALKASGYDLHFLPILFRITTPILGAELYYHNLHGCSNICIVEEGGGFYSQRIIEGFYLTPSQFAIRTMLRDSFAQPKDRWDRRERRDFAEWAVQQKELGRKIAYLVSLDT